MPAAPLRCLGNLSECYETSSRSNVSDFFRLLVEGVRDRSGSQDACNSLRSYDRVAGQSRVWLAKSWMVAKSIPCQQMVNRCITTQVCVVRSWPYRRATDISPPRLLWWGHSTTDGQQTHHHPALCGEIKAPQTGNRPITNRVSEHFTTRSKLDLMSHRIAASADGMLAGIISYVRSFRNFGTDVIGRATPVVK